ncbi:MAG: nucleotide exchange factor GrpE, partial [Myxococcota bacterium]
MEQVLRRAGAERLGEVGERFDPHLHEAIGVTSENDAIEADHIAQVLHPGYRFAERQGEADALIRPARVIVAR